VACPGMDFHHPDKTPPQAYSFLTPIRGPGCTGISLPPAAKYDTRSGLPA
jgi:hypothetical protein